jgi:catechol 2,3-dioxygenase-like lactoylglutathione lyase family enzyme
VEQRLTLVTLGVANVPRARAFYEALGWRAANDSDEVAFFQTGSCALALWSRDELAADSNVEDGGGWGGVALAYNLRSPEEVDAVLEEAERAGATVTRRGEPTSWGGYTGIFLDLDGHPWEVAHNPDWTLREDGSVEVR